MSKNSLGLRNLLETIRVRHLQGQSPDKEKGAVIIASSASYRYDFVGGIVKLCCLDNSKIDFGIQVRVWKFDTKGELKQEYVRIKK